MTAGIEVGTNGEAAFASFRKPGWHSLGTVFDEPLSVDEMMDVSYLSKWNIHEVSLPESLPHIRFYKDRKLIVRTNPFDGELDVLGDVGGRYTIWSNEDHFRFADNLLHGQGTWETMGSIKNGTVVFGAMSMESLEDIVIDPQGARDIVQNYILAYTAHDGTGSANFGFTPIRVVCQNTLNLAVAQGIKSVYKVRHTPGATVKRDEAQKLMGISLRYSEAMAKEFQSLFELDCTDQQFDEIIKAEYDEPDVDAEKGAYKKWETKREQLWDIYTGPTCTTIRGTGWGAFNAMTERLDWGRKPRKGETENVMIAAAGLDDLVTASKEHIFYTVKDLLTV